MITLFTRKYYKASLYSHQSYQHVLSRFQIHWIGCIKVMHFVFFFFFLWCNYYNQISYSFFFVIMVIKNSDLNFSFKKNIMRYLKWFQTIFLENSDLWHSLLIMAIYYQTKTSINFLCRQGLNVRFLIQPSEILPIELIETHYIVIYY